MPKYIRTFRTFLNNSKIHIFKKIDFKIISVLCLFYGIIYNLYTCFVYFCIFLILTPMYGCSSWVLKSGMEAKLRSSQMKVMRSILGKRRLFTEDGLEMWVDWVKRATKEARHAMDTHGAEN